MDDNQKYPLLRKNVCSVYPCPRSNQTATKHTSNQAKFPIKGQDKKLAMYTDIYFGLHVG